VAAAGYYLGVSAGKEEFARLMRAPHEQLDLGRAALLIAQEEYPELDVDRYLGQLDDLGQQARERLNVDMAPRDAVEALARLLAQDEGFRGNQDDYYDPRNSFLNDVLDRRAGIPITLSAVYIEVGRRAGLEIEGVGFPAHFLARHQDVIFDPFNGGRILSESDCRALLAQMTGGSMDFQPRFLEPTPTKQIVARMLNNLKQIYLNARYYRKAIGIMDRLLMVNPVGYDELRDRGAVYAELKQYAQAKADFEAYLKQPRRPDDALAVHEALRKIDNVMTLMDD
jgi:regulator of sirC expression with transglutaminase-like and TPR domain